MLYQRGLKLFFLLLLLAPVWGAPLECVVCHSRMSRGYKIEGKIYCEGHYQQALPRCSNCGAAIQGNYRVVGVNALPVCLDCASHPICFLCGSPADAATGGGKLADGRDICGSDRRTAVVRAEEARRLFKQATQEVKAALGEAMELKVPVKEVRLVDVVELVKAGKGQYQKSQVVSGRVLGLTTLVLKSRGARRWTEPATVHLLSGVTAERMLTVCAHEYAHVWHAENHANYSKTTSEMREGFAEWVAYKVSQYSQRQRQVVVLDYPASGPYYEGLRKFQKLEAKVGVAGVLKHALSAREI